MKARELMRELLKYPPESIVYLADWNEGYREPFELNWVYGGKGTVTLDIKCDGHGG